MPNDVIQHIERLQRRREAPVQGIVAATALGHEEAALLREELERPTRVLGPAVLGSGDADNAISVLTLTLWDMRVSPVQRAAAAWALGRIGGLQPVRKLLNRLRALFVQQGAPMLGSANQGAQEETSDVRATLIEALAQGLDEPTVNALNPYDRLQLRQVCNALLDYLQTSANLDPDLSTTLAMSLAKLALRAQPNMPPQTLHDLLNDPEPVATLAAVGTLSELIPVEQRGKVLDYLYDGRPEATLDVALRELETKRGRPYGPEERRRLLQLADQLWYAEQDTQVAADHMWKKIQQALPEAELASA